MRTAVLGVGRMGRRHIEAVKRCGLNLVGVFDVNTASLDVAQSEHDLSQEMIFTDLKTLLLRTNPELVIVATTADSHCELTCLVAEGGAEYVLVEKPMAVSLEQCDRMITTCAKTGTRLAVNHQMRFMDRYKLPKQQFNTDRFGGLKSMTVVAGNFGFAMNAIHYFEAFRYLTDEDPLSVTAWFSPGTVENPRGAQFTDRAGSIRVETASRKRLYLDLGIDQGHGIHVVYGCRNGILSIDELSGKYKSVVREEQYRTLPTTRYGMPAEEDSGMLSPADTVEPTAAVLRALIGGESHVSGDDGRRAIAVLVAAYKSAENGSCAVLVGDHQAENRIFPWA